MTPTRARGAKDTGSLRSGGFRGRIYSKRLYIVALPQGISGFGCGSLTGVVTGARKRRDLLRDSCERFAVSGAAFRLSDGRLPEYQARAGIEGVTAFLAENPWGEAVLVD